MWAGGVRTAVHAVFAATEVGAFDTGEEALAVFFCAVSFLAVAPFFEGKLGLFADELEFVHEGVGVFL